MKKSLLSFGLSLIVFLSFSQTCLDVFTSAGTFTVPAGITSITVEVIGAGGAGGSNGAGGGGGGGYAKGVYNVTPLSTLNVDVGTGAGSITGILIIGIQATAGSNGGSVPNPDLGGGGVGGVGSGGTIANYAGGIGGGGYWTYFGGGGGGAAGSDSNGSPGENTVVYSGTCEAANGGAGGLSGGFPGGNGGKGAGFFDGSSCRDVDPAAMGENFGGGGGGGNGSGGPPMIGAGGYVSISYENLAEAGTDTRTECNSFTWIDGITYTSSNNTASYIIVNGAANGCDSTVTLDLTIDYTATGIDTQTECESYTWIDGVNYTSSNNTATYTIVNGAANGCDSTVTLDLTINYTVTGTDTQTECESYTWIDGVTYTSSNNTATYTIVNGAANGCDSTVTLDLTINYTVTGTDTQTACELFTWIDGVTYTSSNNTATNTIVNGAANGCDSIVTLDLTINYSVTGIDAQTECESYTWIDGLTYTSSNNTATYTIANGAASGCDSIVTLDLTINYSVTGIDTQTECESYTWIDGHTYTSSNNTATYTIANGAASGCDSIVTLDLTINYSATGTDTQTECNSFTWIDGLTYTSSNNTATFTITNGAASGCDSIVTLDLTINTVDVSITATGQTITANATNATYQWLDCNSDYALFGGETGQTYTPTNNGSYAVEITENNCVDTSSCVIITKVSILENGMSAQPIIYPNPNNGIVNIDLGSLKNVSVKVFNISGQLISTKENINSTSYQFELKESAGIYFIEVNSQNEKHKYRLVLK